MKDISIAIHFSPHLSQITNYHQQVLTHSSETLKRNRFRNKRPSRKQTSLSPEDGTTSGNFQSQ